MNAANNKNICVNCGLCCDGTLFTFAKIRENEIIDPSFDFNVSDSDGKKGFKLGCCYLKDKTCTIYDRRPYSICSRFKCKTLQSFTENKIDYAKAMEIINNTIALKEGIEKNLLIEFPDFKADSLNEKINIFLNYYLALPKPEIFIKSYAKLILDITKLRLMAKEHFYTPKS